MDYSFSQGFSGSSDMNVEEVFREILQTEYFSDSNLQGNDSNQNPAFWGKIEQYPNSFIWKGCFYQKQFVLVTKGKHTYTLYVENPQPFVVFNIQAKLIPFSGGLNDKSFDIPTYPKINSTNASKELAVDVSVEFPTSKEKPHFIQFDFVLQVYGQEQLSTLSVKDDQTAVIMLSNTKAMKKRQAVFKALYPLVKTPQGVKREDVCNILKEYVCRFQDFSIKDKKESKRIERKFDSYSIEYLLQSSANFFNENDYDKVWNNLNTKFQLLEEYAEFWNCGTLCALMKPEQAEEILKPREPGCFLLRIGSIHDVPVISVKNSDGVVHHVTFHPEDLREKDWKTRISQDLGLLQWIGIMSDSGEIQFKNKENYFGTNSSLKKPNGRYKTPCELVKSQKRRCGNSEYSPPFESQSQNTNVCVWVFYEQWEETKIPTTLDEDVDDFKKKVISELRLQVLPAQISLYRSDGSKLQPTKTLREQGIMGEPKQKLEVKIKD